MEALEKARRAMGLKKILAEKLKKIQVIYCMALPHGVTSYDSGSNLPTSRATDDNVMCLSVCPSACISLKDGQCCSGASACSASSSGCASIERSELFRCCADWQAKNAFAGATPTG